MKKFNKFAYAGALLLAGTMSFTACSSDDEVEDVNPTYDGKAVKTQFAFSVPMGAKTSRQTEANTQAQNTPTFLGMQDIKLLTQTSADVTAGTVGVVIETLADLTNAEITTASSKKIYNDVEIPVNTTNFLFYGQAKRGTTGTPAEISFAQGVLTPAFPAAGGNVSTINFALQPSLTSSSDLASAQTALAGILSGIAQVTGWEGHANAALSGLYTKFVKLKAGSGQAILNTMTELKRSLEGITASEATTVRDNIINKMNVSFDFSADNVASFKTAAYATFPTAYDIPEGAVVLGYTEDSNTFSYVNNTIGGTKTVKVSDICYPAALYYYVNTPLKATDNELKEAEWPNTPAAWASATGTNQWGGSGYVWTDAVRPATRTIALTKNINYGVGRFDTQIKCADAFLEDNAVAIAGLAAANSIPVPAEGFPVSAILVGGQPDNVASDMCPVKDGGNTKDEFNKTIYDKYAASEGIAAKNGVLSTATHTLVLDVLTTDGTQRTINVAVELTNNSGYDFYGADGIVKAGSKFYLIAALDPAAASGSESGSFGTDTKRVFAQDYYTLAKFNIANLKGAYVTIPDLRSTKMSLGLSVDLEWKKGLVFDIDL